MIEKRLIYVVGDEDIRYWNFWRHLGRVTSNPEIFATKPETFGLVCFTGGEDVSPELYGHANLDSYSNLDRDSRERWVFAVASKLGIPMTGICRGSQFLNVMCGGTMVQHLRQSHGGYEHLCFARTEVSPTAIPTEKFQVTSTHHQMSVLGEGGILLAWANEIVPQGSLLWDGSRGELETALSKSGNWWPGDHSLVTEAFAYPEQRVFAVQHHPEYQGIEEEAPQWTLRMTRKVCFGEKEMTA